MNVSSISSNTPPYQPQAAQNQVTRRPDHDGDADDVGGAAASQKPAQPEAAEGGKLNTQA